MDIADKSHFDDNNNNSDSNNRKQSTTPNQNGVTQKYNIAQFHDDMAKLEISKSGGLCLILAFLLNFQYISIHGSLLLQPTKLCYERHIRVQLNKQRIENILPVSASLVSSNDAMHRHSRVMFSPRMF